MIRPFPKPFPPQPKPQRLLKGKSMTIAAGFMNGSSAILASDSRELIGNYAKKTTQKINITTYPDWRLGIVGASDSGHYIDLFEAELSSGLSSVKAFDYSKICSIIRATLHRIHKQHIWPRKGDKPSFNTLIVLQGINPVHSRSLLVTEETALLMVREYKAIGIGSYMADYLHQQAMASIGGTYNASTEFLQSLAVFILQQVKNSVEGCDDETLIATFDGISGGFRWFTNDEVREIEKWADTYCIANAELFRSFLNPSLSITQFTDQVATFRERVKRGKAGQLKDIAKRWEAFMKWQASRHKPKP
jgi:hypothetical protein